MKLIKCKSKARKLALKCADLSISKELKHLRSILKDSISMTIPLIWRLRKKTSLLTLRNSGLNLIKIINCPIICFTIICAMITIRILQIFLPSISILFLDLVQIMTKILASLIALFVILLKLSVLLRDANFQG